RAGRRVRASADGVRRGLRRRVERARARRAAHHDPPGEDQPPRRRRGLGRGARRRARGRVCRDGHPLHRRPRLRRRARRRPPEPRDLVTAGARGPRQARPAAVEAGAHLRNTEGGSVIRKRRVHVLAAAIAVALCVPAAGISSGKGLPTKIGKGEGALNVIEWAAYTDPSFAKTFEKKTGCIIHRKDAGSSNEMVALMRSGGGGGGGQYDLVSASGDASLRLIYGGDVQPINVNLIPSWKQFLPIFKSPAHNTVGGVHYGVSVQWGPNTLIYNTKSVKPAPTTWGAIYSGKYKGKLTVPNNPIQIADAALYLQRTQPSLGIKDPYELTKSQLDAAVSLLKSQKPKLKRYWNYATDEITSFKNGDVWMGAGWPYQTLQLQAAKAPVKEI